jgi:hypothetical protein
MAEETKTVVVTEEASPSASATGNAGSSTSSADVEAARAASSATQATEAAQASMALAAVQAARVTEDAATEISSYEERLRQCQERIEGQAGELQAQREAMTTQLAGMHALLSSIQRRLEPAPEPARPSQPAEAASAREEPPPVEEPAPERRKAHRWI